MKLRNDSVCGIFCGACPQENCDGCKSTKVENWCTDCEFKVCSGNINVESCAVCDQFPCDRIINFNDDKWPHHSTVIPNLIYIRKWGLDKWISDRIERWSCPSCGAEFHWYDETCSKCRKPVKSCLPG